MKPPGLPEPQKSSAQAAPLGALTLRVSLREGQATREQVLSFLTEQEPPAAQEWLHDSGMTDELRMSALSLVLAGLDESAANAVASHWGAVANDCTHLIERRLDHGDATLAAWFLKHVSPALPGDAEDQLLARLLMPQQVAPPGQQQRQSALVDLLGERDVPSRDTFPAACSVLRNSGHDDWQALLVRELLAREIAVDPSHRRAVAWVDWLCWSQSADRWEPPDWVSALGYALADRTDVRPPQGLQRLLSDGLWAVTTLRLAAGARRLSLLLGPATFSLVDLALRITPTRPAGTPPRSAGTPSRAAHGDPWAVLEALDTSLWQQGVPADTVAVMDLASGFRQ